MSARGTLTLFKDIFVEETERPNRLRKGRSEAHIARRNECLIDRYYFHAKTTEKRYDVVLKTLSEEFFLSEITIPEIIDDCYDQLSHLKKNPPVKSYFMKKWPHLVW